jgi:DNA-directed RNA polymerase subunit RPC12/RpoP
MPIKVACQCGQAFAAKDQLAGKAVKCPKCGKVLRIPQPKVAAPAKKRAGISDLLDEVGMRANVVRCPGCGQELPPDAVLCVMCGFDMRLGHRIKTIVATTSEIDEEDLGNLPKHDNQILDNAERRIARSKIEDARMSKGVPWWMVFLAFVGVMGFVVGMVSMPQDRVMDTSGWVLLTAGGLLGFFCVIRLLIFAFQESAIQGLLSFFVPLYILYYTFTRWDRCAGVFIMLIGAWALQGSGYLLVIIGPWFNKKSSETVYLDRLLHQRPAIVAYDDVSSPRAVC